MVLILHTSSQRLLHGGLPQPFRYSCQIDLERRYHLVLQLGMLLLPFGSTLQLKRLIFDESFQAFQPTVIVAASTGVLLLFFRLGQHRHRRARQL